MCECSRYICMYVCMYVYRNQPYEAKRPSQPFSVHAYLPTSKSASLSPLPLPFSPFFPFFPLFPPPIKI